MVTAAVACMVADIMVNLHGRREDVLEIVKENFL